MGEISQLRRPSAARRDGTHHTNWYAQASLDFLQRNNKCADVTRSALLNSLVTHWNKQLESEGLATLYDDELRKNYHNILKEQRLWLNKLNNENERVDEEIVRHFIHRIDLEEERLLKE